MVGGNKLQNLGKNLKISIKTLQTIFTVSVLKSLLIPSSLSFLSCFQLLISFFLFIGHVLPLVYLVTFVWMLDTLFLPEHSSCLGQLGLPLPHAIAFVA